MSAISTTSACTPSGLLLPAQHNFRCGQTLCLSGFESLVRVSNPANQRYEGWLYPVPEA